MAERYEIVVSGEERWMRLEDFLFDRFGGLSRMYLREVVKSANCDVNGRNENVGYKLRPGDFVEIDLDLSRETAMRPQELPLNIIYEDGHIMVVDKAAGMLVHPTHREKSGTLLNALAFHLNQPGKREDGNQNGLSSRETDLPPPTDPRVRSAVAAIRPGLIHRLDRETSGLMVIAKNVRAHRILARQFQRKIVAKRYLALVEGRVRDNEGLICAPVGRCAEKKHWAVMSGGKHSETRFRVRGRFADSTMLELEPVTGRTNQLRIHCSYIGHPIIGDVSRGGRASIRLCLHACYLRLRHPEHSTFMEFESESGAEAFKNGRPKTNGT